MRDATLPSRRRFGDGGFVVKHYRSERSNIMDIKPDQQTTHESVRDQAHVGRFSAGVETFADSSDKLHRGRFSEGLEHLPQTWRKRRCGRFSDGLERLPEDRWNLRRGSFADTVPDRRAARR
jgi:hypothetical protein